MKTTLKDILDATIFNLFKDSDGEIFTTEGIEDCFPECLNVPAYEDLKGNIYIKLISMERFAKAFTAIK